MCNDYRRTPPMETIREQWSQTLIPLRFPEGVPNLAPLESIRITDTGTIIRAAEAEPGSQSGPHESGTFMGDEAGSHESTTFMGAELVNRRWSWPGPLGKPVYNYRSDGRDLARGRCLIVTDGFYEFTAPPPPPPGSPKQKRKDKWLFTRPDEDWFCIAGLWRATADVGEAFTMLTCPPGPDVAPYHSRQVVVLNRADWGRWLDPSVPSAELCKPLPDGSLRVAKVS